MFFKRLWMIRPPSIPSTIHEKLDGMKRSYLEHEQIDRAAPRVGKKVTAAVRHSVREIEWVASI